LEKPEFRSRTINIHFNKYILIFKANSKQLWMLCESCSMPACSWRVSYIQTFIFWNSSCGTNLHFKLIFCPSQDLASSKFPTRCHAWLNHLPRHLPHSASRGQKPPEWRLLRQTCLTRCTTLANAETTTTVLQNANQQRLTIYKVQSLSTTKPTDRTGPSAL